MFPKSPHFDEELSKQAAAIAKSLNDIENTKGASKSLSPKSKSRQKMIDKLRSRQKEKLESLCAREETLVRALASLAIDLTDTSNLEEDEGGQATRVNEHHTGEVEEPPPRKNNSDRRGRLIRPQQKKQAAGIRVGGGRGTTQVGGGGVGNNIDVSKKSGADDERPPSMHLHPKQGWSYEDLRVLQRVMTRGLEREKAAEEVWKGTSGQVRSREEVEAMIWEWERDYKRRKKDKERIAKWRQDKKKDGKRESVEESKMPKTRKVRLKSEEERRETKERVADWREMKAIKTQLREADQLLRDMKSKFKKDANMISVKQKHSRAKAIVNVDRCNETAKSVDTGISAKLQGIERTLRDAKLQEATQRWKEKHAKKKINQHDNVGLLNVVIAQRDPERLLRPTSISRIRQDIRKGDGGGTVRGKSDSLLIESVGRRGVPEWRRGINNQWFDVD